MQPAGRGWRALARRATIMTMLTGRISMVCVLAWLGACGSSKSEQPAAGEPAGEAIEVAGAVSVVHEGAEQPLVVGAKVFGADEIVTGANGAVTIRLFHNEARWTLESGKRKRVDASLAWSAPRQAAGGVLAANDPDDSTAAAGRHTEKEAGDTRATAALGAPAASADEDPAQPMAEMAASEAPAAAAPPPPPPPAAPKRKTASTRESTARDVLGKLEAADPLGGSGGGGGLGIKGTGSGGGGLGTTGTIGHGSGTGEGYGLGGKRKAAAPTVTVGTATVSGSLDAEIIRRVIRQHLGRFRLCHETALKAHPGLAGKLALKFTIDASGKVVNAVSSGDAALEQSVGKCAAATLQKLQFPAPKGGGTVIVSYPMSFKVD